jgi:hypothetical protein
MFNTTLRFSSRLFMLAAALSAYQVQAATIPIINPSFEFVDNVSGCSSSNVLNATSFIDSATFYSGGCVGATPFGTVPGSSGWSVSGPDAGVLAPATSLYASSAIPNGQNVAFINTGSISQTLSSTLQVGTYSLSVFIGSRGDGFTLNNYTVELLAGSTVIASDSNSLIVPAGTFVNDTNSGLTVNILAGNPNLGANLGIVLMASEPGGGPPTYPTNQADFDQVALNFQSSVSTVPEPGSLLLLGTGLLGMVGAARRKWLG